MSSYFLVSFSHIQVFLLLFTSVFLAGTFSSAYGQEQQAFKLKNEQEHHQHMEMPSQQSVDTKEWVSEKTGQTIPLNTSFKNEKGEDVTLGQLIDRPTLLLPVYYYCPRSCSFDLANLAAAIAKTSHPMGSFRVISMSFNEVETPEVAATTKPNYTALLDKDFPPPLWTFLTGDEKAIRTITESIGYRFKKQSNHIFIHPSAMVALDKDGTIIKYIYGSFLTGDVDLAIAEAEKQTPATSIRRFLSFCYNYSPTQNQAVFTILKFSMIILLAGGLIYFVVFFLRQKK